MARDAAALVLENDVLRFSLSAPGGAWELLDKRGGARWGSSTGESWCCVHRPGDPVGGVERLTVLAVQKLPGETLHCRMAGEAGAPADLAVVFRLVVDALQVYLVAEGGGSLPVVELFETGLQVSPEEQGEILVPLRMGLLVPAAGTSFEHHFASYDYEGTHLSMVGLMKTGSTLLALWGDPYVALTVRRDAQGARANFTLRRTAVSLQLAPLGHGGLPKLAEAYRRHAEALRYRVPLQRKIAERPKAARLIGASNFKLWTALERSIDENQRERHVKVHWTFDEVARIAEHLKCDVELDDILFHLGGWTRYGYDCRHPDILPANPECGGTEGLAEGIRRVKACGYLFCLHDNYQDIYRDSPSWSEAWLEKDADGSPHRGGNWLGGPAYYTCSREAVTLAGRPQNLPAVREAFEPDLYFIDTTLAVGLQECSDPRHPLTKQEDMRWKLALCAYAREQFGMFGSECGREWAIPYADFFEGLVSVGAACFHQFDAKGIGASPVPFFDMVYRDCIILYGKYGYEPKEAAELVIHHIAVGRPLHYHSLPDHLYWEDRGAHEEAALPASGPDPAVFTRAHNGWAEGLCLWDRFMKNTHEVLSPLHKLTAHTLVARYELLDRGRLIRQTEFANGVRTVVNGDARPYTVRSPVGGDVVLPPFGFLVEAPSFVAFHALSWGGHGYSAPVLFTARSLDGESLARSQRVRLFHGFGEPELAWRGSLVEVRRERVLP